VTAGGVVPARTDAGQVGPLAGITVVEMIGLGPAPYATGLLTDLGATVVRIDRLVPRPPSGRDPVNRDRPGIAVDLKDPAGVELALRLISSADAVIEPFRPGVMERLGLGPDTCLGRNPQLLYLRMTGWGQDGPLAPRAGHDINYIALSGALDQFQRDSHRPMPPLNLLGDYAAGSLFLVIGLLAGVLNARRTGTGDVVDVAIVDGVASLLTVVAAWERAGAWNPDAPDNLLQTAAPFYDVYGTSDDRYLAVGAMEPEFYSAFVSGLGLDVVDLPRQYDRASWPELKARFAATIAEHPLSHWCEVYDGTDACVSPVLTIAEARTDPHMAHRGSFGPPGALRPAPAPRFAASGLLPGGRASNDDAGILLRAAGLAENEVDRLVTDGILGFTTEGVRS
jgi:alpha-methylacyl-CoA racemase